MTDPRKRLEAAGIVAVVLATGMSVAINFITATILIAVLSGRFDVLGENTTQILIGWGGGIIGVLGAFVGYVVGRQVGDQPKDK